MDKKKGENVKKKKKGGFKKTLMKVLVAIVVAIAVMYLYLLFTRG